ESTASEPDAHAHPCSHNVWGSFCAVLAGHPSLLRVSAVRSCTCVADASSVTAPPQTGGRHAARHTLTETHTTTHTQTLSHTHTHTRCVASIIAPHTFVRHTHTHPFL